MQTLINVLLVALMLGFIVLVLKELARSQKGSELEDKYCAFRLVIDLVAEPGTKSQQLEFEDSSVELLQNLLNNIPMFRIKRAAVYHKRQVTHVMTPAGVLEAV